MQKAAANVGLAMLKRLKIMTSNEIDELLLIISNSEIWMAKTNKRLRDHLPAKNKLCRRSQTILSSINDLKLQISVAGIK